MENFILGSYFNVVLDAIGPEKDDDGNDDDDCDDDDCDDDDNDSDNFLLQKGGCCEKLKQ